METVDIMHEPITWDDSSADAAHPGDYLRSSLQKESLTTKGLNLRTYLHIAVRASIFVLDSLVGSRP